MPEVRLAVTAASTDTEPVNAMEPPVTACAPSKEIELTVSVPGMLFTLDATTLAGKMRSSVAVNGPAGDQLEPTDHAPPFAPTNVRGSPYARPAPAVRMTLE